MVQNVTTYNLSHVNKESFILWCHLS